MIATKPASTCVVSRFYRTGLGLLRCDMFRSVTRLFVSIFPYSSSSGMYPASIATTKCNCLIFHYHRSTQPIGIVNHISYKYQAFLAGRKLWPRCFLGLIGSALITICASAYILQSAVFLPDTGCPTRLSCSIYLF